MSSTANASPVQLALQRGATVLTPSVRSARHLGRAFDEAERHAGKPAWRPAQALSWRGWTAALWSAAIVAGTVDSVLLNALQEEALWRRVLHRSDDLGLQATGPAARLCMSAMRLLGGYDLADQFSRVTAPAGTDAAAFSRWYADFTALCQGERLMPSSHLDAELANLLRAGRISAKPEYVLYGFDAVTPAQASLADSLRSTGATVEWMPVSTAQTRPPSLSAFADPQAEIAACCCWVRDTLAAAPGTRIAIVVPDLEDVRADLERGLRSAVAPWRNDVTRVHRSTPFEICAGRPLGHLPLVADALLLLRWLAAPLSFADAGAVLRSPFFSLAPSAEQGAELETWTLLDRRGIRASASLSGDISMVEAEQIVGRESPGTAAALYDLRSTASRALRDAVTHADFADAVRRLLPRAGWPAGELDSVEFQAVDRWNDVLDAVSSLDIFGEGVALPDWLESVARAAAGTLFLPEDAGAPVQVTTVDEAAGVEADSLWFLHADEANWPPRQEPNVLLPRSFQRDLRMPGSDAAVDEAASRVVIANRIAATATARFSFAVHGPQGEQRPSSQIEAMAVSNIENLRGDEEPVPIATEFWPDPLPLPALPEHAGGGVSVIASQALCGFRAYAERRLQLAEADRVEAGLSPVERGEQIHRILELFWLKCKTQKTLMEWSKTSLDTGLTYRDRELQVCIDAVVPAAAVTDWDRSYLDVQRIRLHRLLSDWLDVEAERTPFEVAELELSVASAQLGPLQLKLRVDRIDRIQTSTGPVNVLIDYKTGGAERSEWFGDRPDAPQLPVYAVAGGIADVEGIAFARVRIGRLGMNFEEMLADRSLLGDAVTKRRSGPAFEERMEEWKRDLTALAEAFARGEAVVQPKDYLTTCKNCSSRLLCRVDVSRLEPDDDLLEETEDEGLQ